MKELIEKAAEILTSGAVKVVIGYGAGTGDSGKKRRPVFARTAEEAKALVMDGACRQNLAVYLTKREVTKIGRAAIVATPATLRSILQLAAERQIREGDVVALAVNASAKVVTELATLSDIEEYVTTLLDGGEGAGHGEKSKEARAQIERLAAMSVEDRRAFWAEELGRCFKCYACRSACPICYCERCTMDCNRPQWVPVASHALGNYEYHVVRAMHLAGRCVECGSCGEACPLGIPVHLLTFFAEDTVRKNFGQRAGHSASPDYAMSTFKPDDKEAFIR